MLPVAQVDLAPYLTPDHFHDASEQTCQARCESGCIPSYVRGTYYFNGPAKFQLNETGVQYDNWLDGDGMVAALRFHGNEISFRSRYVQSKKLMRETRESRRIYRTFGTAFEDDRLKRGIGTESPYNVSVFPYRGKLLAFGEQSLPMLLDPATLETLTPGIAFDFNGSLNEAAPFSAHPKLCSRTGEFLNFGIFFSPEQPVLVYYRFDRDGKLACRARIALDAPCSLHDFAASEHYVAFYISPYVLDSTGLTTRGLPTIQSLSWQPERGSQLLVLDRTSGKQVVRISIEGKYCLHTIAAHDTPTSLVIDLIELERPLYDQYDLPDLFCDVPCGEPVRYQIDLSNSKLSSKQAIAYSSAPDFPALDARCEFQAYEDLWMLGISTTGLQGRKFFDQLVHANWQNPEHVDVWTCPIGLYLGSEPYFIADPQHSSHGTIVCHLFDAVTSTSYFALFSSHNIAVGPLALVALPEKIHLGFHATFLHEA